MGVSKFRPVYLPVLTLVSAVMLCRPYAVSCDGFDSIENRLSLPLLIQKLRSAAAAAAAAEAAEDHPTLARLIVPGESFDGAAARGAGGGDVGAAAAAPLRGGPGTGGTEGSIDVGGDLGFVGQRKRSPEFVSRFEILEENRNKRNRYCCSTDMFCFICSS